MFSVPSLGIFLYIGKRAFCPHLLAFIPSHIYIIISFTHSARDNPLSRAIENRETELERLREENNELHERIKLLEAGETHNLTQQVDLNLAQSSQPNKQIAGGFTSDYIDNS